MKIGVYGDSFAAPIQPGFKGANFLWCNTLADKLNGSITNFAKSGTSVYYSYQQFLHSHKDFDLCIFVATTPNRYFKPLKMSSGIPRSISNMDQLQYYRKTLNLNAEDKQTLDWLEGWFLSSDASYNQCVARLMINDMLDKKPNTLVYPCFKDSAPYVTDTNIVPLHEMHKMQLIRLGKDPHGSLDFLHNENYNKIAGHFTESYNNFISELLYKKIKHGVYDFSGLHDIEIDTTTNYYDYTDKSKGCPE